MCIVNKNLLDIIKKYALDDPTLESELQNATPEELAGHLRSLITLYINDRNSSTLREMLVCTLSGFRPINEKLGYNGYREIYGSARREYCEVKPKNIRSGSGKDKKLNGGGSFNDFTWKRLEKWQKENPIVLAAGYIDGRLIYIFQFLFDEPDLVEHITQQLEKRLPDGDKEGQYLRAASFTFRHYERVRRLQTKVYIDRPKLDQCKRFFTGYLYNHLREFVE